MKNQCTENFHIERYPERKHEAVTEWSAVLKQLLFQDCKNQNKQKFKLQESKKHHILREESQFDTL